MKCPGIYCPFSKDSCDSDCVFISDKPLMVNIKFHDGTPSTAPSIQCLIAEYLRQQTRYYYANIQEKDE
jgi:hypothetical protein